MSITENVKKKQKQNTILCSTALFSVSGHFDDAAKILPNQKEGTETGKDSI